MPSDIRHWPESALRHLGLAVDDAGLQEVDDAHPVLDDGTEASYSGFSMLARAGKGRSGRTSCD